MNKYFNTLFVLVAIVAAVGIFSAFNKESLPEMAAEDSTNATGGYFVADYRLDSISNAAVDTWNIGRRDNSTTNTVSTPTNFLSLYTYDIKMHPIQLSGTLNLTLCLDAANDRAGAVTSWIPIDSIAATTTAKPVQLRGTDATANRYRVRVKGSGTQLATYTLTTVWKKKN